MQPALAQVLSLLLDKGFNMNKKLCYILNIVMSLITTFVFLVKNGIIELSMFVETSKYGLKEYSAGFVSAIKTTQIILGILCLVLCIYTVLVSKGMRNLKNIAITLCIICLAANFIGPMFMGSLTIFCYLHIAGSILLFIPTKE